MRAGAGKIRLRGQVEVELGRRKGGPASKLVITEIPYTMIGANIGKFLNDVAVRWWRRRKRRISWISPTSRPKKGIRIVLELKKGADVDKISRTSLYKKTRLEDTFGVNMLAVGRRAAGDPGLKADRESVTMWNSSSSWQAGNMRTLLGKELEKREVQEGLIKAVRCH